MSHDIIGDIHGHADRLEALLAHLGYRERAGAWRHPTRSAVFVGDFIDRGPGQLRTLRLVRAMLEAGSAEAVMGNHEFNAVGWATADPDREGAHLRPRLGAKGERNARQHAAFLAEVVADGPEHRAWIDWFLELPLWIETPAFRVVHACWDPARIAAATPFLREGARLRREDLAVAHRRDHPLGDAVEVLLKGPEAELPPGYGFKDKEGHARTAIRTRWWTRCDTYADAYIGPPADIPDVELVLDVVPELDRPTFVGHYWLDPRKPPAPLSHRVACVDYSVAKGGPLVAYRFDGEPVLSADKFARV